MNIWMLKRGFIIALFSLFLVACGGGGETTTDGTTTGDTATGDTTTDDGTITGSNLQITGAVLAVNGAIASAPKADFLTRLADLLLATKAHAATISGVTNVGVGVTVNLIEVDSTGTQVGEVIATATTDDTGAYSLTVPDSFTPAAKYVVRAVDGEVNLDARVIDTTVDVDPVTDASSDLVAFYELDVSKLSVDEVQTINEEVEDVVLNTDTSSITTTADLTSALATTAQEDEELSNVAASAAAATEICGTITDNNGTALANILVQVRDFGSRVLRAKTETASDGSYCMGVPKAGDTDAYTGNTLSGEYILGAVNRTDTSFAASQWWTSTSDSADGSGGAVNQLSAEMIVVDSTATTVTKDFVLGDGARVSGTVLGHDAVAAEGVKVVFSDYDTFRPVVSARVNADGTYRVNLKPGDYSVAFINKTRLPYASEIWKDTDTTGAGTSPGTRGFNQASRESLTAGTTYTYDATLEAGVIIGVKVYKDAAKSAAVRGTRVEVTSRNLGRISTLRTNKKGGARIVVVLDDSYRVTAYGSEKKDVDVQANTLLTFAVDVSTLKAKLVDAGDTSKGVSSAKVDLVYNDGAGTVGGRVARALTNSEGLFEIHTGQLENYGYSTSVQSTTSWAYPATFHLQVRMDDSMNYGSGVYDGSAISAYKWSSVLDGTSAHIDFASGDIDATNTPIPMPTLGQGDGVGYLSGVTLANTNIKIGITTTDPLPKGDSITSITSRGDGTFRLTLPAGTYTVRGNGGQCTNNVTISNGATTTVDLSTSVCSVQ